MKTMIQMVPSMPVKSNEERKQLRPVGRNVEKYAEIIDGMVDIVKACDELGYWGMSFIEHHFHSEGFEMLPCPGIMNAWLGPYAKRMRMGQLGYVMGTHNPLRVAEETALLDHILKGRFFVGFARGYQARWVRTLGQAYKSLPTLSNRESADQAEADENNQQIFREMVTIVKKAWTQESFSHDGKFFEVPYPYEGIENYPGYPCAKSMAHQAKSTSRTAFVKSVSCQHRTKNHIRKYLSALPEALTLPAGREKKASPAVILHRCKARGRKILLIARAQPRLVKR